jgi:hypothetical protein
MIKLLTGKKWEWAAVMYRKEKLAGLYFIGYQWTSKSIARARYAVPLYTLHCPCKRPPLKWSYSRTGQPFDYPLGYPTLYGSEK